MLAEQSGADVRPRRAGGGPRRLYLPGHPEVFAIGDMMALDGLPGRRGGRHAVRHPRRPHVKRRLHGKEAAAFTYRDLGSMATVSRLHAVVSFKGLRLSGFLGWLVWLVVHITFLTGFKNRFAAMLNWGITFIGGGRAERTITVQQTVGRVVLQDAGGDALTEHLIARSRPGRGEAT